MDLGLQTVIAFQRRLLWRKQGQPARLDQGHYRGTGDQFQVLGTVTSDQGVDTQFPGQCQADPVVVPFGLNRADTPV
ncbi:hypothetical protein D3C77_653760 [compost metagenome]